MNKSPLIFKETWFSSHWTYFPFNDYLPANVRVVCQSLIFGTESPLGRECLRNGFQHLILLVLLMPMSQFAQNDEWVGLNLLPQKAVCL